MKYRNFWFLALLGLMWGIVSLNSKALAQYTSTTSNNPRIVIDKKIRPINVDLFKDNIPASEKVFVEGEQLEFKLLVENSGNETLNNIKVTDVLPKYLSLIFYPGTYDKADNKIEVVVDKLDPGQVKEYLIRATVSSVPTSSVPNKYLQMTNISRVAVNNISDADNASYFIALKSIPNTGANDLMVKTLTVTICGISALGLRKLARGY